MPLLRRACLAASLVSFALVPGLARAGETVRVGDISVTSAWARASIGTARPAAAYLTIVNSGTEADRLLTIETPVSSRAEVHETVNEGDVVRMVPAGQIEIPGGATTTLAPGGLHVMLMDLSEPLERGSELQLTLTFERAGTASVEAEIAGPGATSPPE